MLLVKADHGVSNQQRINACRSKGRTETGVLLCESMALNIRAFGIFPFYISHKNWGMFGIVPEHLSINTE
jgi:hypothetical protein